jgi:hypothetical protein
MQRKLNLIKLTNIIYINRAITLSIYLRLNKSINYKLKEWMYKIRVTCDKSHIISLYKTWIVVPRF